MTSYGDGLYGDGLYGGVADTVYGAGAYGDGVYGDAVSYSSGYGSGAYGEGPYGGVLPGEATGTAFGRNMQVVPSLFLPDDDEAALALVLALT